MELLLTLIYAAVAWLCVEKWQEIKNSKKARYACRFYKTIVPYGGNELTDGIQLTSPVLRIPFIPFIGISIHDFIYKGKFKFGDGLEVDDHYDFTSGRIESIEWSNKGELFTCIVAPRQMSETNILAAILGRHEDNGWIVPFLDDELRQELEKWREDEKK